MLLGDKLFDSYLQEYMWKKQHQNSIFGNVFFIGYPFITEPKVNAAISRSRSTSSLNERTKTYAKQPKLKPV